MTQKIQNNIMRRIIGYNIGWWCLFQEKETNFSTVNKQTSVKHTKKDQGDYLEKVFNVHCSIIIVLNASNLLFDRWII